MPRKQPRSMPWVSGTHGVARVAVGLECRLLLAPAESEHKRTSALEASAHFCRHSRTLEGAIRSNDPPFRFGKRAQAVMRVCMGSDRSALPYLEKGRRRGRDYDSIAHHVPVLLQSPQRGVRSMALLRDATRCSPPFTLTFVQHSSIIALLVTYRRRRRSAAATDQTGPTAQQCILR